jgi:hypothetical protein
MSRYRDEKFSERFVRCRDKALTAWVCAALLRPGLNPAGKETLAKKILKLAESTNHRLGLTATQVREIVLSHTQCGAKDCPMLIFADPLARELNAFFQEDE